MKSKTELLNNILNNVALADVGRALVGEYKRGFEAGKKAAMEELNTRVCNDCRFYTYPHCNILGDDYDENFCCKFWEPRK